MDFDQTGTHYWKWLDFGDLDLIFKVTPAHFNVKFVGGGVASCLHCIFWTNGWILTKLAQTHYWDGGKKWLDLVTLFSRSHQHFAIWPKTAGLHPITWTKWQILAKLHICDILWNFGCYRVKFWNLGIYIFEFIGLLRRDYEKQKLNAMKIFQICKNLP